MAKTPPDPTLFSTLSTAEPPGSASKAFRSVSHPHRTVEYASGALGRETPRTQDLSAPRYGTVANKVGLQLIHSLHVEGVENEPHLPGDFLVSWGSGDGSGCDGGGLPGDSDCLNSAISDPQLQASSTILDAQLQTSGIGEIINTVPDRIIVIGRRLIRITVVSLRFSGMSGIIPALGTGREFPDDMEPVLGEEEEAEECTAEMIGDMGGLLTPQQQQLIADFLNSVAAESLWRDSGYKPLGFVGRLEQAGFLLPNGTFIPAVTPDANGCTTGAFGFPGPGPIPDGTFLVHTHPYTNGEINPACGLAPYGNVPSSGDVIDLHQTPGITLLGLIIDADGFIVFTKDYDGDPASDQAKHKGGEDGKCGFQRIGN